MNGAHSETFFLPDRLTFETVGKVLDNLKQKIVTDKAIIISLAKVMTIDSSSLALMVAIIRETQQHHTQLQFSDPPEQLLKIIKVAGLESMIPFVSE